MFSSMMPVIWLKMITSVGMSFTQVMLIWSALSLASLLCGIWLYPWHNVRVNPDCDSLVTLKKNDEKLLTVGDEFPTLWESIKNAAVYFRTPMFFSQILTLTIFNFFSKLVSYSI